MKRIVFLDHTAQEGGGELAMLRLIEALERESYAPRVILFSDGRLRARLEAARVPTAVVALDERVRGAGRDELGASPLGAVRGVFSSAAFVPRLIRAIRGARADLVVANTLKAAVFAAVAAPLAGRGWVWHLHDRLADDYLSPRLARAMRALAVIGPRWIVANSAATLATLPERARRKASIAYPGLPREAFGEDEVRPAPTVPTIGMLGRVAPTKGQREFLSAASAVARTHPDAVFRVVGRALFNDAPYEDEVRALAEDLGIADRVTFVGWVDDPADELRGLTAFVHASPVPEPFGQVIVEAMAVGVPVIATDAGGAREILDPSGPAGAPSYRRTAVGQLVRPADPGALAEAIGWTLENPGEVEELARRAHESAMERFTVERTRDAVTTAWRAALEGRRRRGGAPA